MWWDGANQGSGGEGQSDHAMWSSQGTLHLQRQIRVQTPDSRGLIRQLSSPRSATV